MNSPRSGGADLRTAFLGAARAILDEPDTDLDLRKVAERAGKSRTAPYLVFGKTEEGGGLRALKVAVATHGFEELVQEVERILARPADPEERIRRLGEAYLEFADRHPRLFRLMFGPEVSGAITEEEPGASSPERVELLVARAHLEDLFRRVVSEAQEAGVLEAGDPLLRVLGAWALFHGAAMLLLDGQLELAGITSAHQVAELVTPLLLDEAALPVARAAEALARARLSRGFPLLDTPHPRRRFPAPGPDPLAVAQARARWGERIPSEVWDILARPPEPGPLDAPADISLEAHLDRSLDLHRDPALARAFVTRSTALRRARRMRSVLEGSRILWIDDRPALTAPEVSVFRSLGASVTQVPDTASALARLGRGGEPRAAGGPPPFDIILSDIARPDSPSAGVDDLPALREAAPTTPVIFFVAKLEPGLDRPFGSAGITNDPVELLHLVLDQLERTRV
jgi:CheY-like chemotaxis protein